MKNKQKYDFNVLDFVAFFEYTALFLIVIVSDIASLSFSYFKWLVVLLLLIFNFLFWKGVRKNIKDKIMEDAKTIMSIRNK